MGWVPDADQNVVRTTQLHPLLVTAVGATVEGQAVATPVPKTDDFFQVLRLVIPGFRASSKVEKSSSDASRSRRSSHTQASSTTTTVATLEFDYEVKCASKCTFLLLEVRSRVHLPLVQYTQEPVSLNMFFSLGMPKI